MSRYTLGEIAVWLVLAAALGFVLGWLTREIMTRARRGTSHDPAPAPANAPDPSPAPAPAAETPDEPDVEAGKHPGSAKPLAGGAPPAERFVVKGNEKSMIYHAPGSPSYDRTTAQTWFETEAAAEAAGFRKPKNA